METKLFESLPFVQDMLSHPAFNTLKNFAHHGTISCYQHTIAVAQLAYQLSRLLHLDYIAATRGALLHDFYMYNWRTGGPRLHGLRHPHIALNNAAKHFDISKKEKDIILKHMWPLTPIPPRYGESWVVTFVDKIVSLSDYARVIKDKMAAVNIYFYHKLNKLWRAIAPFQSEQ